MARPWRNPTTHVWHLRQRTPTDLLPRLKGKQVTLPIGDEFATVRIGAVVQASLRTKEATRAKELHAIADAALRRFWGTHRSAMDDAARTLERNAKGDCSPAEVRCRFTAWPAPDAGKSPERPAGAITADALFHWWKTQQGLNLAPNTVHRYAASWASFIAFSKSRDLRVLSDEDIYAWAVHRRDVDRIRPHVVNRNDLIALSSVFKWAIGLGSGRLLKTNPVQGVRLEEPPLLQERARAFRANEVSAILRAALAVGLDEENPTLSYAKRWCPWLAAYSGARVSELARLRADDIRDDGGVWVMDVRNTKSGRFRTIPLHPHLIEQGFLTFVTLRRSGPLFIDLKRHLAGARTRPEEIRSKKLADWVRETTNLEMNVDPNHGWRHTFKTRALSAGMDARIRDAFTGHRAGNVARSYESPPVSMLAEALKKFPRYEV